MKLCQIQNNISFYKNSFENAWPYKHLVIDNFLDEELAEQILVDFPLPNQMDVHGSDSKRLLGRQINPLSPLYSFKPSLNALFAYLKQKELRNLFGQITDTNSQILSDPDYYGSGLLLASRGGVHNIHADRTYHLNSNIFPRLVFLLYFNKDWQPNYGGGLQLWNKNITRCKTIAPIFNRAVLFQITSTSYHSIEDVTCPEDVYRRALNYYYLSDKPPPKSYMHDTIFFPRPDQRIDYWKNLINSNFPKDFIATIVSRSPISRSMYSSLRSFIKGSSSGLIREVPSDETRKRWNDFNI